jgi:hypothetical protein
MSDGKVNNNVVWESENEKIIKIFQNGIIEAVGIGETTVKIYAKSDKNIFSKIKVKVLPPKETNISTSDYSFLNQDKTEREKVLVKGKILKGYVKDIYGNFLKDVNVKISYDKTSLNYFSKDGYFSFENIPEDTLITLEAKKQGFTTRKISQVFKKSNNNFYELNFEKNLSLKDEPEIIDIAFNNKKVYYGLKVDNLDNIDNDIKSDFNFKKINYINISFLFSENIDKEYFENSFEVIVIKENNEIFFINKSNEKIIFNWLNNSSNLVINLPTKYNLNFGKTLYRIQFRNGISDLNGNISKNYIFNNTGFSKNGYNSVLFSISN